jgi:hypothetical protein
MTEYAGLLEQSEVVTLLERGGLDPHIVRTLHIGAGEGNSWVEVYVLDEHGNKQVQNGEPVLTTLPIFMGSFADV